MGGLTAAVDGISGDLALSMGPAVRPMSLSISLPLLLLLSEDRTSSSKKSAPSPAKLAGARYFELTRWCPVAWASDERGLPGLCVNKTSLFMFMFVYTNTLEVDHPDLN